LYSENVFTTKKSTMKKMILIAAVTLITSAATAQENITDVRDKLIFGVKAYSNVYDTQGEAFQANPKLGFAGGAFLAIPIGRFFGLQPEVLFSQKGFQASGRILGSPYNITRTTNFIDVPLLFAVKLSEFFTILAGPQYSYLMNQKDVFTTPNSSLEQETQFKNDNVRKNIFCITGGIDITLKHIVLGARAGWDVQNNNGDGTSTTPRYKNMWYQGTIGYRLY
jgi:hypothetical protein